MPKFQSSKTELRVEAGFVRPEFLLLRDVAGLLDRLYARLAPYGLRVTDMRYERGAGNPGEQQIVIHLLDYWMTIRVRVERIEMTSSNLPREYLERFRTAAVDALMAVKEYRPALTFRAFAVALSAHVILEGQTPHDLLANFVTNAPTNLGPRTGAGVVFYFGPHEGRLLSSLTADISSEVPDALHVRAHGVWDASAAAPESLLVPAETFIRQAFETIGLELPT